jgi:hypothetical protein
MMADKARESSGAVVWWVPVMIEELLRLWRVGQHYQNPVHHDALLGCVRKTCGCAGAASSLACAA